MTFRPWREAMQEALYGPHGFYVRHLPGAHFRTSVTAGPLFATAVRRLAGLVDDALGRPDPFDLVDLGSGGGELLAALPDVPVRWRLVGVDLSGRWSAEVPAVRGLLLANEWLDNVPLDVVVDGRIVEVATDGTERLGAAADPRLLAWAERWWPGAARVEVGLPRDEAWAGAVARLDRGLAVAIDYGHTRADRRTTLTAYRDGRQVRLVPDGSCDVTAHVAVDACAGATGARVLSQREALSRLGISASRPSQDLARSDAAGYLAELQRAGAAAGLLDPARLGGFAWLVQAKGIADPLTDSTP